MPSKEWYASLEILIKNIGEKEFVETGYKWINACIEKSKQKTNEYKRLGVSAAYKEIQESITTNRSTPEWVRKVYGQDLTYGTFFELKKYAFLQNFQNYFYHSLGGRILRGFLHAAIILPDSQLLNFVDTVALSNPNNAQDAIHVYAQLPKEVAVPKLSVLQSRVKNKNVLSRIKKAFTAIAKKEGLSKAEIEESVIPDFGLNEHGQFIETIDDYQAIFTIQNLKTSKIHYVTKDAKEQKTLPKALKDNFSTEVKAFKKQCVISLSRTFEKLCV